MLISWSIGSLSSLFRRLVCVDILFSTWEFIQFLVDNNAKFNMDRDAVAKVTQQCNMYVPKHIDRCTSVSNLSTERGILPFLHKNNRPICSSVSSSQTLLLVMALLFVKPRLLAFWTLLSMFLFLSSALKSASMWTRCPLTYVSRVYLWFMSLTVPIPVESRL